jgi:NhaD family Na+/H+ antiporter
MSGYAIFMVFVFIIGLIAVIFEHKLKVSKSAIALVTATLCWTCFSIYNPEGLGSLSYHLADVSEIVFFLIGAMTIVELIDSHNGFCVITNYINTTSRGRMLWIVGGIAFFMSSILDNLTTTIVMVTLLRKVLKESSDRKFFGAIIVIAANAGGAWTPIGDVTTTMLWINGFVSTGPTIKALFLPSLVCCVVSISAVQFMLRKKTDRLLINKQVAKPAPSARLTLWLGIGSLIFVPIFKTLTGVPPYMGMLVAMGVLWLVTDIIHHKHQNREHLRIPHVLTKIDISGVLFFFGILLSVSSLQTAGVLKELAVVMDTVLVSGKLIAFKVGLASAFVDNVPLVAALMGMYNYPMDHTFWQMIAYCAGVGGSIFVVGSAAGVAYMGMEKIDSLWYCKHISIVALLGYVAGFLTYLLIFFM